MALLEKHRSVIYAHLVEQIGEEAAEAMLAQFPSRDLDEPVTKEFVALQVAALRADLQAGLHTEITVLRSEMHSQTERLMTRVQLMAGLILVALTVLGVLSR